jgi:hypothetical protein
MRATRVLSGGILWKLVVSAFALVATGLILFPLVFRARAIDGPPSCPSQLRQLSIGLAMYAQDYGDRLPPLTNGGGQRWTELVYPYVKNRAVYRCPADASPANAGWGTPPTGASYGLNWLALAPDGVGAKLDAALHPNTTVLLADVGEFRAVPLAMASPFVGAGPRYRHRGNAAVAFLDEHVKLLKPGRLEQTVSGAQSPLTIDSFPYWKVR